MDKLSILERHVDELKLSVRRRQIDEVTAMINSNLTQATNGNNNEHLAQSDWKFLIYDSVGQDILAPLFTIKELRNHGVTLHLLINSDRDPVPDVAAIYFVVPNDKTVERICKDLTNKLYDSYYLNFITPISRAKLDQIANAALLSNSSINIKQIYDRYLNFIALEDDLFILRESEKHLVSYYAINKNDATADEIANVIDMIVECLFSLLVTLKIVPTIRCPKGGPSEYIAEKLTKRIRETMKDSRNTLFKSSFRRPLLCLVDRTTDMSTPLHHTWTYQALIHDLLNTKLNNVEVIEDKDKPKPKTQFYDLNPIDKFWRKQRGNPFPQVAEAVQQALDDYRKHEDEVKNLKSAMGLEGDGTSGVVRGDDDSALLTQATAKLNNAVSSLPELLENKRVIGMHTTIATAVLDEIKARKLDNFFETEEKIMGRNLIEKATLEDMLVDPDYGEPSDKYRLFLISYICDNPKITDEDTERYIDVLEKLGCSRTAFDYIKRWKTFSRTNVATLQSSLESSNGILKTAGMFTKLMTQGSQFVMEGVKNLVLKEHYLPITKIVDSLMDCETNKSSQEVQEYATYDPVEKRGEKKVYEDAIVFIVGGGNYIEYQNLVDYCRTKKVSGPSGKKHVIYGSTDLINAKQFLQQLEYSGAS